VGGVSGSHAGHPLDPAVKLTEQQGPLPEYPILGLGYTRPSWVWQHVSDLKLPVMVFAVSATLPACADLTMPMAGAPIARLQNILIMLSSVQVIHGFKVAQASLYALNL
jgi:hypothetical protein